MHVIGFYTIYPSLQRAAKKCDGRSVPDAFHGLATGMHATAMRLNEPTGIAVDAAGNVGTQLADKLISEEDLANMDPDVINEVMTWVRVINFR